MNFWQLIEARRSIRAFSNAPVDDAAVQRILEAANIAPSAGNLQGYEIYLVTDQETREQLVHAARGQAFVAQAPVVLVFCANGERSAARYGERGVRLYSVQDATIATTFAMLAAADLGLGTVWVGAFDDEMVRAAINAPPQHHPVAMLPIGHPTVNPPPRPRRPLSDLVHRL